MSVEAFQVPVDYYITTDSDWTRLQIIEGGSWSNFDVECLEGQDRVVDVLYNKKNLLITKNPNDENRVLVHAKFILNIDKEYLQSNITYRITKGDIGATVVKMTASGAQGQIVHASKVPGDPKNPIIFDFPVQSYLLGLEKKKQSEKAPERVKIENKPEKEENFIAITFNAMFKEILQKKEPTEDDVKEVFEWLGSQGENATKLLDADTCIKLVLKAETYFCGKQNLKEKAHKESNDARNKIKKRYDDLRKIEGKISVQTPYLGGLEKEEKKVAPSK